MEVLHATFTIQQNGCGYIKLNDDNLQNHDLYIVNADNIKALVTLYHLLLRESLVPPYACIELLCHKIGIDILVEVIERQVLELGACCRE